MSPIRKIEMCKNKALKTPFLTKIALFDGLKLLKYVISQDNPRGHLRVISEGVQKCKNPHFWPKWPLFGHPQKRKKTTQKWVQKWPLFGTPKYRFRGQKRGKTAQKGSKKWSKKWSKSDPKMVIFGVTTITAKSRKSRFCDFCAFWHFSCQKVSIGTQKTRKTP